MHTNSTTHTNSITHINPIRTKSRSTLAACIFQTAALLTAPAVVFAEQANTMADQSTSNQSTVNQGNANEVTALPEIVVTATRIPMASVDTSASVSVITREDIEAQNPREIIDVLQSLPGVNIARTGSRGSTTSVFIRGAESDEVLVLIDGVRANPADGAAFAWSHLSPSQIERIELVRGLAAFLYGSEGIGGVIHIFTRKESGISVKIAAGSDGYQQGTVSAGGKFGPVQAWASVNRTETDGFSATAPNAAGQYQPDDDGYENDSYTAGIAFDYSSNGNVSLAYNDFEGTVEYDSIFASVPPETITAQNQTTLNWQHDFGSAGYSQFIAGYGEYELDDSSDFQLITERTSLDFLHAIETRYGTAAMGIEYRDEDAKQVSGGVAAYDQSIDTAALFAEWLGTTQYVDYTLAGRYDKHEQFGDETTGRAAIGLKFGNNLRFDTSFSTAFKAPKFNDLYSPGFGGFFAGNPNLQPETARNWEFSLSQQFNSNNLWQLTYYHTEVTNQIAFVGTNAQAINIAKSTRRGVEWKASWNWQAFYVNTYIDISRAYNQDGVRPVRRPEEKAGLQFDYRSQYGHLAGINIDFIGDRVDNDFFVTFARQPLRGYAVANIYGRVAITDYWNLSARVDNAFDQEYQQVFGYNATDRQFTVSTELHFK